MDTELIIIIFSSILAAASFMAFALPFLEKSEKKERYRSVIEKKRKSLFEQAKEQQARPASSSDALSAKESVAAAFKVQELMGGMGEKVRDYMLQAGIRSPTAPITFIIASIICPFIFIGIAMMFIAGAEEPPSNTFTLLILFFSAFFGYKFPSILVKNQIQKRVQEINITFPDALDMMLICVQGGIGLEQTVNRIADEMSEHSETLAEELGILSAEMAMLNDRRTALQDFARRVGSAGARSFATALIQAEQYGTSISTAMRVMADELRDQRMQEAERKAASLPPKLTVPMILFFLPSLFIVIIGPAVIQAMAIMK
jgi:tight adherence protein C